MTPHPAGVYQFKSWCSWWERCTTEMLVIGHNGCMRQRAVRSEAIMDSRKEDMCCLLQMAQYMFCSW